MNERDIFLAALERATAKERSEYVSVACAGDFTLQQRVEDLLLMHQRTGEFLHKPLVERLAEGVAALESADETVRDPSAVQGAGDGLGFLSPSDQPGSLGRLGHYEVQQVIGRGGMGIVLRAFDEHLHRIVAIKVMAAPLATNAAARRRFLRESRAAAAVCHDHIVTIHAVEQSGDLPYLVMQCVSGMSLQDRIDRDGPLELHEILRIGMQTAAGLAAAHAQGVIHRDIKPANILLENGVERVKITDFGLARASADASVSQSGAVVGTPQYMAPEQARGEALDVRTDLFSLGSVLYAMCTGRAPFRASSSIACLKRVCEDAASPIREANADIPEWLVRLIDKLQAKNPQQRYQSAAEVAELLGQRLAQLQHSTPPAPPPPPPTRPVERRWRSWAVAAVVILCLAATFGVAEGTGVTKIVATVIRLLTPDGTLIVEVTDPGMKVTIDGDGGLVITGVGKHEVRLKPGSHKLQADKNGQRVPLERELVSIATGGREVVKVRLEATPATVIANVEKGAFVLLGGKGVAERKFDTLAAAVQSANDGDMIEVRGNGPFATGPIKSTHALTIRAGKGYRPVVRLSADGLQAHAPLLVSQSSLVLEGLEFQRLAPDRKDRDPWHFGLKAEKALHISNCRLLMKSTETCLETNAAVCELRNSEFLCSSWTSSFNSNDLQPGQRLVVENCLFTAGCELVYQHHLPNPARVRFIRNTFRGGPLWFYLQRQNLEDVARDGKVLEVEASDNVFDGGFVVRFEQYLRRRVLPVAEAEKTLVELLDWRGERNLFATGEPLVRLVVRTGDQEPANPIVTLAGWRTFWETTEDHSIEGRVRYQGGDLLARSESAPEQLTPQDWQLREDSAGYQAGKDGKDLGADVDLVGPGQAYERWKQTPEYQVWLKDSGQLRAETPRPEPGAFVLLGGKGAVERNFDTLGEAVLAASDSDTIEVRGNGPFVTTPIVIERRSLTIRAGEGFWPVIKADPDEPGKVLLDTNASLALEGLEFQWLDAPAFDRAQANFRHLVVGRWPHARLHVANCRFLMNRRDGLHEMSCMAVWDGSFCQLRNCQLVVGGHGILDGPNVVFSGNPNGELLVDHCLMVGRGLVLPIKPETTRAVLARNTFLGYSEFVQIALYKKIDTPLEEKTLPLLQIKASANIFDGTMDFFQKTLSTGEAEKLLTKLVAWRENGNVYLLPKSVDLLRPPSILPTKTMADWKTFWGMEELDSQRGQAKFHGGDLVTKAKLTPELLTPDDFRLRPDSAGYRAGKDGKDLGADVDLVGPGPAYERWKKTPEYQEWLKEIGQET